MLDPNKVARTTLPPVPLRPDTTGRNKRVSNRILGRYYSDNKALIKQYLDIKGEKETRKAFGISSGGFKGVMARLFPERYPTPARRTKRKPTPSTPPVDTAAESSEEEETVPEKKKPPEPVVEADFQNFWKESICNRDGSINIEQVKRELYDFHRLMRNTGKVYCALTDSRISKPLTDPDVVIRTANDLQNFAIHEAIEEEKQIESDKSEETPPHLPDFPRFSRWWPPSVQRKWLEVYEKMLAAGRKS